MTIQRQRDPRDEPIGSDETALARSDEVRLALVEREVVDLRQDLTEIKVELVRQGAEQREQGSQVHAIHTWVTQQKQEIADSRTRWQKLVDGTVQAFLQHLVTLLVGGGATIVTLLLTSSEARQLLKTAIGGK